MTSVRDFVRWLRPAGAPGTAAPAGVPADRGAEMAAELSLVFEALIGPSRKAADLVAEARRDAEHRRRAAAVRAEGLLADARERAEIARAKAAATAVEAAAGERAALLDRARADADDLVGRAAERLPDLVERVVAEVRTTGVGTESVR